MDLSCEPLPPCVSRVVWSAELGRFGCVLDAIHFAFDPVARRVGRCVSISDFDFV